MVNCASKCTTVAIVVIVMKTMFTIVIMEMISSRGGGAAAVAINVMQCVAGDNGDGYSEDIDDEHNDAVDKD